MTRVQKERFFNEEDYLRLKDSYILTPEKLTTRPERSVHSCIRCPASMRSPSRWTTIPGPAISSQVLNGKYIRMALILKLLEVALT